LGFKDYFGIIEGGHEDINRVRLTDHKHIFLTSPDYYTCEPLPEEWIQTFEETQNHMMNLLGKSELKSTRYSPNVSRNDSFRKFSKRENGRRQSIKGQAQGKEVKIKGEIFDTPVERRNSTSPVKSIFNEEKSISHVLLEKDNHDDSLEIVRKILVESIQDYEKGDRKPKKKATKPESAKDIKNEKPSVRAWSAALKPANEKTQERVWSAALKPLDE